MAEGLQQGGVEADGIGTHGVRSAGVVCHGDVVAAEAPPFRCAAVGLVARVFAVVLRGVCAAHVLSAVAVLLFSGLGMVLRVFVRGLAAALGCIGIDDGGKHLWHLAAVEEPHRSFFDRMTVSDKSCRMIF